MRACLPVLLLFAIAWPSTAFAGDGFAWPEGRKAAVSLAYDDALDSQLDNAIPALDRHGLKGIFYLIMIFALIVAAILFAAAGPVRRMLASSAAPLPTAKVNEPA